MGITPGSHRWRRELQQAERCRIGATDGSSNGGSERAIPTFPEARDRSSGGRWRSVRSDLPSCPPGKTTSPLQEVSPGRRFKASGEELVAGLRSLLGSTQRSSPPDPRVSSSATRVPDSVSEGIHPPGPNRPRSSFRPHGVPAGRAYAVRTRTPRRIARPASFEATGGCSSLSLPCTRGGWPGRRCCRSFQRRTRAILQPGAGAIRLRARPVSGRCRRTARSPGLDPEQNDKQGKKRCHTRSADAALAAHSCSQYVIFAVTA